MFGLSFALLVGEVGLRIVRPVPPDQLLPFPYRHDALARIVADETYIRFDADLGWTPKPGVVRSEAGIAYEANAAGLRADREVAASPAPGVRRIAAFGDSFAYCDEVELADCWTAQLEAASPATEVLNFGVPGYGPDQAYLRYERDGAAYRPCAVLVGYMPENLNRTLARFFPFYEPSVSIVLSKPRFDLLGDRLALLPTPIVDLAVLDDPRAVEVVAGPGDDWYVPGMFTPDFLDNLLVARLIRTTAYHRRATGGEGLDLGFLRAAAAGPAWAGAGDEETFNRVLARRYAGWGDGLEIVVRILVEHARSVERAGATPVVLILPRRMDVTMALADEPRVYAPLLERLASEGIATLDLLQPLVVEARRGRTRALFAPNAHYSPRANEVVAAYLARALPPLIGATCPQ